MQTAQDPAHAGPAKQICLMNYKAEMTQQADAGLDLKAPAVGQMSAK